MFEVVFRSLTRIDFYHYYFRCWGQNDVVSFDPRLYHRSQFDAKNGTCEHLHARKDDYGGQNLV
jgi:hypothetical protein